MMNSMTPPRPGEILGDDAGSIEFSFLPDRARLELRGEVDARLNAELASVTTALVERGMTVDVETRDLTFIDSAAIALMAHLANRLPARVRFVAPTEQVRFLLDLTQVAELVDIIDPEPALPPVQGGTESAPPLVAQDAAQPLPMVLSPDEAASPAERSVPAV